MGSENIREPLRECTNVCKQNAPLQKRNNDVSQQGEPTEFSEQIEIAKRWHLPPSEALLLMQHPECPPLQKNVIFSIDSIELARGQLKFTRTGILFEGRYIQLSNSRSVITGVQFMFFPYTIISKVSATEFSHLHLNIAMTSEAQTPPENEYSDVAFVSFAFPKEAIKEDADGSSKCSTHKLWETVLTELLHTKSNVPDLDAVKKSQSSTSQQKAIPRSTLQSVATVTENLSHTAVSSIRAIREQAAQAAAKRKQKSIERERARHIRAQQMNGTGVTTTPADEAVNLKNSSSQTIGLVTATPDTVGAHEVHQQAVRAPAPGTTQVQPHVTFDLISCDAHDTDKSTHAETDKYIGRSTIVDHAHASSKIRSTSQAESNDCYPTMSELPDALGSVPITDTEDNSHIARKNPLPAVHDLNLVELVRELASLSYARMPPVQPTHATQAVQDPAQQHTEAQLLRTTPVTQRLPSSYSTDSHLQNHQGHVLGVADDSHVPIAVPIAGFGTAGRFIAISRSCKFDPGSIQRKQSDINEMSDIIPSPFDIDVSCPHGSLDQFTDSCGSAFGSSISDVLETQSLPNDLIECTCDIVEKAFPMPSPCEYSGSQRRQAVHAIQSARALALSKVIRPELQHPRDPHASLTAASSAYRVQQLAERIEQFSGGYRITPPPPAPALLPPSITAITYPPPNLTRDQQRQEVMRLQPGLVALSEARKAEEQRMQTVTGARAIRSEGTYMYICLKTGERISSAEYEYRYMEDVEATRVHGDSTVCEQATLENVPTTDEHLSWWSQPQGPMVWVPVGQTHGNGESSALRPHETRLASATPRKEQLRSDHPIHSNLTTFVDTGCQTDSTIATTIGIETDEDWSLRQPMTGFDEFNLADSIHQNGVYLLNCIMQILISTTNDPRMDLCSSDTLQVSSTTHMTTKDITYDAPTKNDSRFSQQPCERIRSCQQTFLEHFSSLFGELCYNLEGAGICFENASHVEQLKNLVKKQASSCGVLAHCVPTVNMVEETVTSQLLKTSEVFSAAKDATQSNCAHTGKTTLHDDEHEAALTVPTSLHSSSCASLEVVIESKTIPEDMERQLMQADLTVESERPVDCALDRSACEWIENALNEEMQSEGTLHEHTEHASLDLSDFFMATDDDEGFENSDQLEQLSDMLDESDFSSGQQNQNEVLLSPAKLDPQQALHSSFTDTSRHVDITKQKQQEQCSSIDDGVTANLIATDINSSHSDSTLKVHATAESKDYENHRQRDEDTEVLGDDDTLSNDVLNVSNRLLEELSRQSTQTINGTNSSESLSDSEKEESCTNNMLELSDDDDFVEASVSTPEGKFMDKLPNQSRHSNDQMMQTMLSRTVWTHSQDSKKFVNVSHSEPRWTRARQIYRKQSETISTWGKQDTPRLVALDQMGESSQGLTFPHQVNETQPILNTTTSVLSTDFKARSKPELVQQESQLNDTSGDHGGKHVDTMNSHNVANRKSGLLGEYFSPYRRKCQTKNTIIPKIVNRITDTQIAKHVSSSVEGSDRLPPQSLSEVRRGPSYSAIRRLLGSNDADNFASGKEDTIPEASYSNVTARRLEFDAKNDLSANVNSGSLVADDASGREIVHLCGTKTGNTLTDAITSVQSIITTCVSTQPEYHTEQRTTSLFTPEFRPSPDTIRRSMPLLAPLSLFQEQITDSEQKRVDHASRFWRRHCIQSMPSNKKLLSKNPQDTQLTAGISETEQSNSSLFSTCTSTSTDSTPVATKNKSTGNQATSCSVIDHKNDIALSLKTPDQYNFTQHHSNSDVLSQEPATPNHVPSPPVETPSGFTALVNKFRLMRLVSQRGSPASAKPKRKWRVPHSTDPQETSPMEDCRSIAEKASTLTSPAPREFDEIAKPESRSGSNSPNELNHTSAGNGKNSNQIEGHEPSIVLPTLRCNGANMIDDVAQQVVDSP